MAELVFKKLISEAGVTDLFYVSSSATSTEEIGNPVYPPVRRLLSSLGISSEGKEAVQLSALDYGKYDMFIGMDSMNVRNMMRIFGTDPEDKVMKLMDFVSGGDVLDPWYTGDFEATYRDVLSGCRELLSTLLES